MSNPFAIQGPAVLNVSGGRTSALMLRRVLDAHGGALPRDVYAVTCNTGDEREETLRFLSEIERRWCALVWLERDATSPGKVREVSFETASRNAEAHVGRASPSMIVAKSWPGENVGVSVSVAKLVASRLVKD